LEGVRSGERGQRLHERGVVRLLPEGSDGYSPDSFAEWVGGCAGVQDDAALEGCSNVVAEPREVSGVAGIDGAGGFDLDPDDLAGCGFEDEVNLAGLVAVS